MGADRLLPFLSIGLVLGLAGVVLLLAWRRRLPADFVGRVKRDAARAMLRALLVLLAGVALACGNRLPGPPPFTVLGDWLAIGLVALGGGAFVARLALYWLRIRPEMDLLQTPASAPAMRRQSTRLPRDTDE